MTNGLGARLYPITRYDGVASAIDQDDPVVDRKLARGENPSVCKSLYRPCSGKWSIADIDSGNVAAVLSNDAGHARVRRFARCFLPAAVRR